MPELWDIYNRDGMKTGKTIRRGDLLMDGEYHLRVEVWIVNSKSEVLIQRRAMSLETLPGVWTLTTGSVLSGETNIECCIREAKEEIGIGLIPENLHFIKRITYKDTFWDIYFVRQEFDLDHAVVQPEEVDEIKWAGSDEIRKMLGFQLAL